MVVVKLVGALLLVAVLACGTFVVDMMANDGRLFYAAVGRDRLVGLCTPPIREALVSRGFAPSDIAFGVHPSISLAAGSWGRSQVLAGVFNFTDGPMGPRVDGSASCTVQGSSVTVDVAVDHLPVRAA